MSTMKPEGRREDGVENEQDPQEIVDRLAGLLPEDALDEAVQGLRPEDVSGPGVMRARRASGAIGPAAPASERTHHHEHHEA